MAFFGNNYDDETPTSMHVRRTARKYKGHKLMQGVNHNQEVRRQGGESTNGS